MDLAELIRNHSDRLALPDLIAQRCDKPLVTVKASGGIRSWIERWI